MMMTKNSSSPSSNTRLWLEDPRRRGCSSSGRRHG
jgi:hypothetical protein